MDGCKIEFNRPVKTETVEEGGQAFHEDEDADGEDGEEGEHDVEHDAAHPALNAEPDGQDHAPQDFRQLCRQP